MVSKQISASKLQECSEIIGFTCISFSILHNSGIHLTTKRCIGHVYAISSAPCMFTIHNGQDLDINCCEQSNVMDKFHSTIQHTNFTKFRDYVLQTFGPNYTLPKS